MFLQCRHCFFPNYVTSLSCRHCRKTIEYVTHSDFLDRCPRCKVLRLRAELRIHHGFCRLCEKLKDVDKELYDQDWWEVDE